MDKSAIQRIRTRQKKRYLNNKGGAVIIMALALSVIIGVFSNISVIQAIYESHNTERFSSQTGSLMMATAGMDLAWWMFRHSANTWNDELRGMFEEGYLVVMNLGETLVGTTEGQGFAIYMYDNDDGDADPLVDSDNVVEVKVVGVSGKYSTTLDARVIHTSVNELKSYGVLAAGDITLGNIGLFGGTFGTKIHANDSIIMSNPDNVGTTSDPNNGPFELTQTDPNPTAPVTEGEQVTIPPFDKLNYLSSVHARGEFGVEYYFFDKNGKLTKTVGETQIELLSNYVDGQPQPHVYAGFEYSPIEGSSVAKWMYNANPYGGGVIHNPSILVTQTSLEITASIGDVVTPKPIQLAVGGDLSLIGANVFLNPVPTHKTYINSGPIGVYAGGIIATGVTDRLILKNGSGSIVSELGIIAGYLTVENGAVISGGHLEVGSRLFVTYEGSRLFVTYEGDPVVVNTTGGNDASLYREIFYGYNETPAEEILLPSNALPGDGDLIMMGDGLG